MSTVDIRKGDLVKFTHKTEPEVSVTTRILNRTGGDLFFSKALDGYISLAVWDAEILERPVDTELVDLAIDAYREAEGYQNPLDQYSRESYRRGFTQAVQAVLDHVNQGASK